MIPHIAEYRANGQWSNWLQASERDDAGFAIVRGNENGLKRCLAGSNSWRD